MFTKYIDVMEKALSAYSPERISSYISEVKEKGLTEHGFPRLGSNIGILIAYGRRLDLLDTFIEIMDLCCSEMPKRKKAANDFSIREVCCCLMLMEKKDIIPKELIEKWRAQLKAFDPWEYYDVIDDYSGKKINNWAMFGAVSDFVRGKFCDIDTMKFVEWQLPSQIRNFEESGMYRDGSPRKNPYVYDLVVRVLTAFLLHFGYEGKYKDQLVSFLDKSVDATLKFQSSTGEMPFGGRSNQFLIDEGWLCAYFELEAARFNKKGDTALASQLKAAADLSLSNITHYLAFDPISHAKNRYNISSLMGCESYGYFNKYMITLASLCFMALFYCDDTIPEATLENKEKPYIYSGSEEFNKTFIHAGGYFLEFDTYADLHYDANGLGRIHKKGASPVVALSVPFPPSNESIYKLATENPIPMSLCAEGGSLTPYTLTESEVTENFARAVFNGPKGNEEYKVSSSGVDAYFESGVFMLPVFDFDGANETDITIKEGEIRIKYNGSECIYTFDGTAGSFERFSNRNGIYRVYKINGKHLHIEIKG